MPEIDELIEQLNNRNTDSSQRRNAVKYLENIGGAEAVEALIESLADEERAIRRLAASTLGKLGDQKAVEPLIKALQDEDNYVRKNAAAALGQLGDKRAIEPLRQITSDMLITVRTTAKESLMLLTGGKEIPLPVTKREAASIRPTKRGEANFPNTTRTEEEDKTTLEISEEGESTPSDKEETQNPTEPLDLSEKETEEEISEKTPEEDSSTEIEITDENSEQLPHRLEFQPDRLGFQPQYVPGERMLIFFQDDIESVKDIYQQLSDKQKLLHEIESQMKAAMEKLNIEQSAKSESLVKYSDTIQRMEKEINAMRAEYETVLFERADVEARLASKLRMFAATILRKKKKEEARLAQLETKIVELKQRIEETERTLNGRREEHNGLSETGDSSQTELEELEKRRKSCEAEIFALGSKIEDNIINVIQSASFVEFERKIENLADKTDNINFFRTCATRLRDLLIERNHILERAESASIALAATQEQAQNSLNGVCEAIAAGFYTTSSPKKANAKITGSIHFKEVETAFDITGVTGSVSGSGTGTANYALYEPAWNPTEELAKQVGEMTEAWASLGAATGDFELHSAKQNALQIGVAEYVHFIRVELEKDFYANY